MRRLLIITLWLLMFVAGGSALAVAPILPMGHRSAGNPKVTVWVNTGSRVYHCQGSRWYGKTKTGRFMQQKLARRVGYRPAFGTVCG